MSLYDEYMSEEETPVIFMDQDGVVIHINAAFSNTFLWSEDELVGQPVVSIIPPSLQDAHNMGFTRYKLNKKPTLLDTPLDLQIQMGDSSVIMAKHYIVALDHEGRQLFAAKITPREE